MCYDGKSPLLLSPPSAGLGQSPKPGLALTAPVPNPARGGVTFEVAGSGEEAELSAWDIAGRRVATVWHGRATGPATLHWNGAREDGGRLPAGLYLLRLEDSRGGRSFQRVVLLE